jgi:shikimate kinase
MKHTRIYLVGFMGAGKTTVGRLLAHALGWRFIDLDQQIQTGEKLEIPEIFRIYGEPYFREIEQKYLQELPPKEPSIVALGGGAFMDSENRAFMDKTGITVWLKVSFTKVAGRVKIDGTRPKFTDRDQAERLFESRQPYYALAQVHVETDDGSPDLIVARILEQLSTA